MDDYTTLTARTWNPDVGISCGSLGIAVQINNDAAGPASQQRAAPHGASELFSFTLRIRYIYRAARHGVATRFPIAICRDDAACAVPALLS